MPCAAGLPREKGAGAAGSHGPEAPNLARPGRGPEAERGVEGEGADRRADSDGERWRGRGTRAGACGGARGTEGWSTQGWSSCGGRRRQPSAVTGAGCDLRVAYHG